MKAKRLIASLCFISLFACKHANSGNSAPKEVHDQELLSPNRLTLGAVKSSTGISVVACPYQSTYDNKNYDQLKAKVNGMSPDDIQATVTASACEALMLVDGKMYFFTSTTDLSNFRDNYLVPALKAVADPNPVLNATNILSASSSDGWLNGGYVVRMRAAFVTAFANYINAQ